MPRGPKRTHSHDHAVKTRRLERHLSDLGLASEDHYRDWCIHNGLSKE